jgi:pimeloyl-ACP methyl ester carboxylesterase
LPRSSRLLRLFAVPTTAPPRVEGTVSLPGGRRLGYAEFGDPRGPLVLWCHGTPGARRQLAPAGRRAALELGLRVVCVERPGVGMSTDHLYGQVRDWAPDAIAVADALGAERFMVAGLSGGGPYALACAHDFPDRVVAVGLLGSVVPTTGDDVAAEGLVALAHTFNGVITPLRRPLGVGLWGVIRAINPLSHLMLQAFSRMMPEGDQRVLGDPDVEAVFVDDISGSSRRQFQAFVNDVVLMGKPWGFHLAGVKVPVRWWHGDADPIVPLEQAQRAAALLPDVELMVRPGESHLGDFAAADEVLAVLADLWHDRA